jgi:hypothetical protein
MNKYLDRLIRAAKLDPELYEEVEADASANGQAVLTVVLSSVAAGFGSTLSGGLFGLLLHIVVALGGWYVWAFLSYIIGTRLLPQTQTRADMGELLRCTGFSSAPGLLQVLGVIPRLGTLVRFVAAVWMLAAFVIAVRQALDYSGTIRALAVCILGWLVLMAMNALMFMVSMGRLTL